MKHFFVLATALCATVSAAPQADLINNSGKFCPLERDGNRCKSRPAQYKCGAFIDGVPNAQYDMSWIGAMPDALNKKAVRNNPDIKATFNNVKRESFLFDDASTCAAREAFSNAGCIIAMSQVSKIPMDSCTQTIFNEDGAQTVGNLLCTNAYFANGNKLAPGPMNISFRKSTCGKDWENVVINKQGTPFVHTQQLCCEAGANGEKAVYKSCDGSAYNKVC